MIGNTVQETRDQSAHATSLAGLIKWMVRTWRDWSFGPLLMGHPLARPTMCVEERLHLFEEVDKHQAHFGSWPSSWGPIQESLFGKEPSELKYVCSGFAAISRASEHYTSSVFNIAVDGWHDDDRSMDPLEKHYVVSAITQWKSKGTQNCDIADF